MRRVLIASLALALSGPTLARAQDAKPPAPEDIAPAPPPDSHPVAPPGDGPQPGEPAPSPGFGEPGGPLHPGDEKLPPDADRAKPAEKPKLDEAAGGMAGGILAKVAGTAAGGPVGGFAASMVGSRVGSATVRVGKRMLGRGNKPVEQAAAAPEAASPASAVEPAPEPVPVRAEPDEPDAPS